MGGAAALPVSFRHFPLPRAVSIANDPKWNRALCAGFHAGPRCPAKLGRRRRRPVHMALGESRPGVARSARPGGWGQHHYFEERSDEAALQPEDLAAQQTGKTRDTP